VSSASLVCLLVLSMLQWDFPGPVGAGGGATVEGGDKHIVKCTKLVRGNFARGVGREGGIAV
jgi:hypothetical protein